MSRVEAWLFLCAKANYTTTNFVTASGESVTLERGQFHASLRELAREFGWGRNRVARFMHLLTKESMLQTRNGTLNGTVYEVHNFNKYQPLDDCHEQSRDSNDTTNGATNGATNDTTPEEDKNITLYEESFFSDPPSPVVEAMGSLMEAHGVTWRLRSKTLRQWCATIENNPRFTRLDLPHEIDQCSDWYESKGRTIKSANLAVLKWLKKALAINGRPGGRPPSSSAPPGTTERA